MSAIKQIDLNYFPRTHQLILHQDKSRFKVIAAHRRFGKTHWALMEMVDRSLSLGQKNPQYAYIAPTYGQAKRVAWEILKGYAKNLPDFTANEAELRVDFRRPDRNDRVRIYLLGAENYDAIRGQYFDGVVLDEYAAMSAEVWGPVIRPALSDRQGWAVFISTPKGANHFKDIYDMAGHTDGWSRFLFKASETKIIALSELEAAKAIMSEEEYLQEFEVDFGAALVGAYYGKQMKEAEQDGRICIVPYEKSVPVSTYWDLGIGDSTAIWFIQEVGKEVRVINYLEDSGRDLPFYAKEIQKPGYYFDEHVLPHDAAARDLSSGKTREEVLRSLGLRTRILPRHTLEDGINAVRVVLSKCWFDALKCERGINSLKNYEKRWDSKNKIFSSAPLHNWASHGADAFRCFAMGSRSGELSRKRDLPRKALTKFNVFGG